MNAIQITEQPMRLTALAYCREHDIASPDECERVRLYMCHRAYQERMRPWMDTLAKLHPAMYSLNLNEPLPASYVKLQEQVQEIADYTAAGLGLTPPALIG